MSSYAWPVPGAAATLLGDLLGKTVTVKLGRAVTYGAATPVHLGVYALDKGETVALVVHDLPLAAFSGAALMLMSAEVAKESVRAGKLDANLADNFQEILNVCTRMFDVSQWGHLVLRSVHHAVAGLPADVMPLLTQPGGRMDLDVTIAGYGTGHMALLAK